MVPTPIRRVWMEGLHKQPLQANRECEGTCTNPGLRNESRSTRIQSPTKSRSDVQRRMVEIVYASGADEEAGDTAGRSARTRESDHKNLAASAQ